MSYCVSLWVNNSAVEKFGGLVSGLDSYQLRLQLFFANFFELLIIIL
jgi:hypothetical protein